MKHNENERLILFSDAVIAITITLLVLEIRLPVPAEKLTDPELWDALVELWPRFLGYIVSFVVIGVFWVGHRHKFEWITRSSSMLIWLNLLFLMGIGIMPFITDILAENGGSLSTALYALTVAIISLLSASISFYAAQAGLIEPGHAPPTRLRMAWSMLSTASVFLLSIPVAYWDADMGKYFWLLLVPVGVVSRRVLGSPPERQA